MNTTPAVIVNVQRQPGANTIDVVDRIKALLPTLSATLPPAVQVSVLTDRTTTIRASIADVQLELGLTVALVVLVIFLFLRRLSTTWIPAVAVPLSLIGTCVAMYFAGFSLNNLTLMALTISTGFVVDDAIVMIENIARYVEAGEPPLQAALRGAQADRLHHRLAHGLADRGADPAALHERHRRPFVPRVRGHVERHHPRLGGRLAHVDPDDVRANLCGRRRKSSSRDDSPRALDQAFQRMVAAYGRTLTWVLGHERLTLLVFSSRPLRSPHSCSQPFRRVSSGTGHRRHRRRDRGGADELFR